MRAMRVCMAGLAFVLTGCAPTRPQTSVPAAPMRVDDAPEERQPEGWPPYYPPRLVRDLAGTDAVTGEAASVMGPCPRLVLAMAQYQKDQKDQALKTLTAAVQSYDWSTAKADNYESWIAHILRREAEALINPKLQHNSTSRPASTSPAAGPK